MIFGKDGRADITDKLKETAEYLVELVAAQMRLLRLELWGDARSLGGQLVRLLAFTPPILFGYGCLTAALVLALASATGLLAALLLVAVGQLTIGVWGAVHVLRSLGRVRLLDRSRSEIARSVAVASTPASARPAP